MAAVAEAVRNEYEALGHKAGEVWQRASELTDETLDTVRRKAIDLKGDLRNMPEDVADRVRQAPLRSVGGAMAVGLIAGALFGWLASRGIGCKKVSEE